jgi:glycosyltransferase involved in cell wall biosynthesis
VHNGERFLARAIDSALRQTLHSIEIICVDDGSTDKTPQILRRYAAQDPRIHTITLPKNQGTLHARVTAAQAAVGQFILSLDADDMLKPHIALRASTTAIATGADMVAFTMLERPCGSLLLRPLLWASPRQEMLGKIIHQPRLMALAAYGRMCNSTICNCLIARSVLLAAVGEIPDALRQRRIIYGEDTILCLLCLKHARSYTAIADAGYCYLRHAASVTGGWPCNLSKFLQKINDDVLLARTVQELIPANLQSALMRMLLGGMSNRFFENSLKNEQNLTALAHALDAMDRAYYKPQWREIFLASLCRTCFLRKNPPRRCRIPLLKWLKGAVMACLCAPLALWRSSEH